MIDRNWPDRVNSLQEASLSLNTHLAYAASIRRFSNWCSERSHQFLPAEPVVVAEYLADLIANGLQWTSIRVHAAAVSHLHVSSSENNPCKTYIVGAVLRGARRRRGGNVNQKNALSAQILAEILCVVPEDLKGIRDRAMLLIGFAGALRRSEIVSLRVEDLLFTPEGVVLKIKKSKTDWAGEGVLIAIPNGRKLQPVAALKKWLTAASISSGPIFRPMAQGKVLSRRATPLVITRTLKNYLQIAGYDPMLFGSHSLRAGFITEAVEAGLTAEQIMDHSRHTNPKIIHVYIRRANLFKDHVGESFL
ncbi:MAG: site-specific integrase [Cypionkella sp.]